MVDQGLALSRGASVVNSNQFVKPGHDEKNSVRENNTMTATATSEAPKEMPKQASASVVAQQAAMLQALPFSDTRDFDEAARGYMGTLEHARIANAQGRVVWSLEAYGFLSDEKAPATVNPSLWRQSRLNMNHGLFEVVPGVYQIRGLDIANMTLIEGDTGVDRRGYPDLDRRRARRDGALFQAPWTAEGLRGDLHPHPYRSLGRRARRARRGFAGRAAKSRSSRPICSWSMRFRKTSSPALRCCGARNISSGRCWPRVRAARSIAGLASRWQRARWRCCARPI